MALYASFSRFDPLGGVRVIFAKKCLFVPLAVDTAPVSEN